MKNIIICADHEIGYNVVRYILKKKQKNFNIKKIFTTDTNNNGFWKGLDSLNGCKYSIFSTNEQFINEVSTIKDIDLIFLVSWKHLLTDEAIKLAKIGVINLHYSLLPKYRGVYPVNNAIINGEQITGITYHWINSNIDAGNIIVQDSIKIKLHQTTEEVLKKLDKMALKIFKNIWMGKVNILLEKNIEDNEIVDSNYYSRKYFELTNKIDTEKTYKALELINLIRGKNFKNKSSIYYEDEQGNKYFIYLKIIKDI